MREEEKIRLHRGRKYSSIIVTVLWVSALIVQLIRIVLKESDHEYEVLTWIVVALLIAALFVKLTARYFPGLYRERPDREELDTK
jgi:hypothetical protein